VVWFGLALEPLETGHAQALPVPGGNDQEQQNQENRMKLIRGYAPVPVFNPLTELERELGRFLGNEGACTAGSSAAPLAPPTDVREDDRQFLVAVDLPGVRREDVQVSLHEGVLSVTGEVRVDPESGQARYHRRERFVGRFARRFGLGTPVVADGVKAVFRDGVLLVTVPKAEVVRPKSIEVVAE
jgi:HSP20 family protein